MAKEEAVLAVALQCLQRYCPNASQYKRLWSWARPKTTGAKWRLGCREVSASTPYCLNCTTFKQAHEMYCNTFRCWRSDWVTDAARVEATA